MSPGFTPFTLILLFLYFIPTIVALARGHNNTFAIALSDFFFAWTGLGWIVCLIWACSCNIKPRVKRRWI